MTSGGQKVQFIVQFGDGTQPAVVRIGGSVVPGGKSEEDADIKVRDSSDSNISDIVGPPMRKGLLRQATRQDSSGPEYSIRSWGCHLVSEVA